MEGMREGTCEETKDDVLTSGASQPATLRTSISRQLERGLEAVSQRDGFEDCEDKPGNGRKYRCHFLGGCPQTSETVCSVLTEEPKSMQEDLVSNT